MIRDQRIPLGPLEPDLAAIMNQRSLTVADNVLPSKAGYVPMPSLSDMGEDALAKRPRGGLSGVDSAGNPYNLVGTEDIIYEIASQGLRDVSAPGGYAVTGTERWSFAQFDQLIFAATYSAELQYCDLMAAPLVFAAVPSLRPGVGVPRARHLGVVGNHLVLGNVYDPVFGAVPGSIWWGAINQPLSYPKIGSDEAASLQSDRQPLRGHGGWVQAVRGGAEVGAIFQERSIWRMDYRGGAVIFDLTRVVPDLGLLIPELAIPFQRSILFLTEDGFHVFNYTDTVPVGKERVDNYFFSDWDALYPDRVWGLPDPDSTRIWIIYPGAGHTNGTPNRVIVYDWALDRWATGTLALEMLVHVLAPGIHLDSLPDDDLDDDTLPDFDTRLSLTGARTLGGYGADYKLGTLDGPALVGLFETGDIELAPGRRACSSSARPVVTGNDHVSVAVAALAKSNSAVTFGPQKPQDKTGKCPVRADGRYHRFRMQVGETGFVGFEHATALDVAFNKTGKR